MDHTPPSPDQDANKATKPGAATPGEEGAPATPATRPLTARTQRFVEEYLLDLNATQAYLRSHPGVQASTARAEGSRLLARPGVADAIAAAKAGRAQATGLTAQRVLREVARLALFDARKLFDDTGAPLPISALDEDTAAALIGLEVREEFSGTGANRTFTGYTKKYKLADKGASLDRLMKHLGLFEKDNSQKVDPVAQLLAALGRSVVPVVQDLRDVGDADHG